MHLTKGEAVTRLRELTNLSKATCVATVETMRTIPDGKREKYRQPDVDAIAATLNAPEPERAKGKVTFSRKMQVRLLAAR